MGKCNLNLLHWIGLFNPLDVLIGVRAYTEEEAFMTCDVHDDGRLNYAHIENVFLFLFVYKKK